LPSRTAIISADVPLGDTALTLRALGEQIVTTASWPPVAA
jgi:hypothetical protein